MSGVIHSRPRQNSYNISKASSFGLTICDTRVLENRQQWEILCPTKNIYGLYEEQSSCYIAIAIDHFRVVLCLCLKTNLRAKPFIRKWVSPARHFHANQKNFHMKSFSGGLIFKQKQKATRKWLIYPGNLFDVNGFVNPTEKCCKRCIINLRTFRISWSWLQWAGHYLEGWLVQLNRVWEVHWFLVREKEGHIRPQVPQARVVFLCLPLYIIS